MVKIRSVELRILGTVLYKVKTGFTLKGTTPDQTGNEKKVQIPFALRSQMTFRLLRDNSLWVPLWEPQAH
jgi:hypothetical protein